jgi:alpha-tubulin suppressor-like RCC1 family protein
VWCWGKNEGPNGTDIGTPTLVPQLQGATLVMSSMHQYCGLLKDGQVRCWAGDLGDPNLKKIVKQMGLKVHDGAGVKNVTDIAVDNHTACAITKDEVAFCWGNGKDGRLGDGKDHRGREKHQPPTQAKGLKGVVDVETSGLHTCARTAAGDVFCWGSNGQGECGDGTTGGDKLTPVAVRGLTGVEKLSLGDSFSCALVKDGSVWCWGENSWGQTGSGIESDEEPVPVRVALP